jgi:hypothetical protein
MIRADAPDPRAALESVVGPVVWFEVEQDEPVIDPVVEQASEAEPERGDISQIDADPAEPAGRVVPIRPPEPQLPPIVAGELQQLRRIVSAAGRLADLSARLERARPPPDPSHSVSSWRRSGERPSGSEWMTR